MNFARYTAGESSLRATSTATPEKSFFPEPFLYIRLNWQRFKVEAGFGFAVAVIVVVVLLILLLMIRHSIKKAQKEREQKKLEAEQERQAKIEAGEPVPSLGDGKFEAEDIKKAAEIVGDKIGDLVEKGKKEIAEMKEKSEAAETVDTTDTPEE